MIITIEEAKKFILNNSRIKDNCIVFLGSLDGQGYGLINIKGKTQRIHRVMAHVYGLLDIKDKLSLALHKEECNNKHCFKEEHLYSGTYSNNRQDVLRKRPDPKRSHCKHGHELNKENSYYGPKGRDCLICRKLRDKIRNDKRKKTPKFITKSRF